MKTTKKLTVLAPMIPGQPPKIVGEFANIAEARAKAAEFGNRRDLKYHDVSIWKGLKLVERCGPCR